MKITHLVPIAALAIFVSGCSGSSDTASTPVDQVEVSAPSGISKDAACIELITGIGDFATIIAETALEIQLDANGNVLPPSAAIQVLVDDLTASLNAVSQDAPDDEVKGLADAFATAVTAYHAASMAQQSPDAAFEDITDNAEKIYATCS
jgi:predicted methyltransferase